MSKPSVHARRRRAGLSMVETIAMVSLAASTIAVAGPTIYRTLRSSKIDEAADSLQRQLIGLRAYYNRPQLVGDERKVHCLPASAGPVPREPSSRGITLVLGDHGEAAAALQAFEFVPSEPTRFRYTFTTSASGCALPERSETTHFVLMAEGDLDADGVFSRFLRRGSIDRQGLHIDPLLVVQRRIE